MDPGEQTMGTRDEHYNLIAVLYHALQGAENCETYTTDAEATGRGELAAFFREAQATQRQLAERAKGLLGILEVPPEPSPRTGDVPPRSADVQGWETPPPPPRRESPGGSTRAPGDVQRGETSSPVAPPGRGPVPPEASRMGDIPPPGEERPQREGPLSREIPPPGEEEPRPEDPRPGP